MSVVELTRRCPSKISSCSVGTPRSGSRIEERPRPDIPIIGSVRRTNQRWRDLEFHGDFRFYGTSSSGDWHDYLAPFTHGRLEAIVVMPEAFYGRNNVSGGRRWAMNPVTRAASAFADQVLGDFPSSPTLGSKLDEFIAALPIDCRQHFEDRVSELLVDLGEQLGR